MKIESKWTGKGHKRKLPCRIDIRVESAEKGIAVLFMTMVIPGSQQLVPDNRIQLKAGDKFSISSLYAEAEPSTEKPMRAESLASSNNGKLKFGEFFNVLLTAEEFTKLQVRFGEDKAKDLIEKLSAYIASSRKGRRYTSHYAVLLNWERRDKERTSGTTRNARTLPETYTPGPDYED